MPSSAFIPSIIAAVTDVGVAVFVHSFQPDLPGRFLIFQVVMFGLALLLATRYRGLWIIAFFLLIGGVILTGFTVGMFYVPTVVAAGWVMVKRLNTMDATSGFLDTEPKNGVILHRVGN